MIGTITKRSLLARKARSIIIGLAILLGVAFVSGSFILADSLRNTFDSLFSDLAQDIDLEVRSAQAFDAGPQTHQGSGSGEPRRHGGGHRGRRDGRALAVALRAADRCRRQRHHHAGGADARRLVVRPERSERCDASGRSRAERTRSGRHRRRHCGACRLRDRRHRVGHHRPRHAGVRARRSHRARRLEGLRRRDPRRVRPCHGPRSARLTRVLRHDRHRRRRGRRPGTGAGGDRRCTARAHRGDHG